MRRRSRFAALALLAAAPLLQTADARAGEVERASADVDGTHEKHAHGRSSHESESRSSGSSGESSSGEHASGDSGGSGDSGDSGDPGDGGSSGSSWTLLVGYALLSPFFIPNVAVEQGHNPRYSIAPYPYDAGAPGYFSRVGVPGSVEGGGPYRFAVAPAERKMVGAQVALDAMPPLGGPARWQGSLRIVTALRFEVDAAYALFTERGAQSSDAGMGRAHVDFRFAQGEKVQFRAGLGYRQWIDPTGSSFGVDGLYGMDVFWGRPMTTSLEASGGTLGSAWAFEARGTVGALLGPAEIFGGYDALWIGSSSSRGPGPTAYLGGPVAGVRVYF